MMSAAPERAGSAARSRRGVGAKRLLLIGALFLTAGEEQDADVSPRSSTRGENRCDRGAQSALLIPALALTVLGTAFLLWGEVVSARASSRGVAEGRIGARRTVLVLGFGNRSDEANAVNRYRVRAGLRTLRTPADCLIVSGGAVRGPVPEARILARFAIERGYAGPLLEESESRSTEENICNAVPLLEDAQEIAIVSNSLHAERARELLRRQRPDLGARLIRAEEYRFGEVPVIKAVAAALALVERRRRKRPARPS